MAYTVPTVDEFKARFDRDFPFGNDSMDTVRDTDVQRGIDDALSQVNEAFCSDQTSYSRIYLQMAAHCMVMNLRASAQGVVGKFPWLDSSTGAGSVSRGAAIPQRILESPLYSYLSSTRYGAAYLMLALPWMSGGVKTVRGFTRTDGQGKQWGFGG